MTIQSVMKAGVSSYIPLIDLDLVMITYRHVPVVAVEHGCRVFKKEGYKSLTPYQKRLVNFYLKTCLR